MGEYVVCFFIKQKTAYEVRISDWSSDVCSSDLAARATRLALVGDIANAWLFYAADQSLLGIAQDTVANAGRSVELTRARLDGGSAPRTDLRPAELVPAQAQPDHAQQTTALSQDVKALHFPVGAPISPEQPPPP